MDYKWALEKAKRAIYNHEASEATIGYLEQVITAIEPYRKFKRINATHVKEMQKGFKDGLRHIYFGKREHFDNQYKFGWWAGVMQWDDSYFNSTPRNENQEDYITLGKDELSGEKIYLELVALLEKRKQQREDYKPPLLDEFATFLAAHEKLCKEHACSEKALGYLTQR